MRFVPYQALDGIANIVVDGAPNESTVLTLSHWPHSGTPPELLDDLSAQIVFNYLAHPEMEVLVRAVTNNHFDEDGLMGVWTMTEPEEGFARRQLVVDVARAGDFGTYRSRDAARISFAISALADSETSTLDPAIFALPYPEHVSRLYQELLPHVDELLDDPDDHRSLWEAEDAHLAASEAAIADGTVKIDEIHTIDLAVVTVPDDWNTREVHRFTQGRAQSLHPMAIHNATRCFRILLQQGYRYTLQYRYETWVQYVSRKPIPRVDLAPLATLLTEREADGARWVFEGVADITPALHLEGAFESRIAPDTFRSLVEQFMLHAPPAWNPYDA